MAAKKKKEKKVSPKEEIKTLPSQVVKQMLTLATNGFGLVAALAWNSVIQEFVNSYLKTWIPGSGLITLLIYALIVTILAVLVTLQLTKLLKTLEE